MEICTMAIFVAAEETPYIETHRPQSIRTIRLQRLSVIGARSVERWRSIYIELITMVAYARPARPRPAYARLYGISMTLVTPMTIGGTRLNHGGRGDTVFMDKKREDLGGQSQYYNCHVSRTPPVFGHEIAAAGCGRSNADRPKPAPPISRFRPHGPDSIPCPMRR